jgi:hypothetical protein
MNYVLLHLCVGLSLDEISKRVSRELVLEDYFLLLKVNTFNGLGQAGLRPSPA